MQKQKAIIFDLDGTAIDSPKQKLPTARLIKAVRALEGKYYLCAATGRVWLFAEPVLKSLALHDPCIISGGTQICRPTSGEILWQCALEPADLDAVVSIAQQYPNQKVLYNNHTDDDYLHGGLDPMTLNILGPVYFFNIKLVPQDIATEIAEKLTKLPGISCMKIISQLPDLNDIHVTNRHATKEHAVAELLKALAIDAKDTIGVGDGHNDTHLFNAVGHKVAMSNGVDELKGAADEVIGDVSDDGFAAYLEQLAKTKLS
jgi:HAD superfamily hydrolase (TIGR01484 family)